MNKREARYWKCRYCGKKVYFGFLSSKPELIRHVLSDHSDIKKYFLAKTIDELIKDFYIN